MGLLNFLNRRTSVDAAFEHPFTRQVHPSPVPALPTSRGTLSAHGNRPSTLEGLQQSSSAWNSFRGITITEISAGGPTTSVKPRLIGITEEQSANGPYNKKPENQQQRPKSSGCNLRDVQPGLSVTSISTKDEKGRMQRDRVPAPLLSPLATHSPDYPASPVRRQSTAFVDILDAQGEIKSCSFKSRVEASGSRDFGEDVADRNIKESGVSSPRVSAFFPSTGMFSPIRPRGSPSVASSFRSLHRTESILEESVFPIEDSDARSLSTRSATKEGQFARRPSAAAISMHSPSSDMVPISPVDSINDDSRFGHRRGKKSSGKASVISCRTTTPVQSLSMICDSNSLGTRSQCASPRDLHFKQRQFSLPGDQLQGRTKKGSVRAAREALQASGYARERLFLKEGVSPLLPHQRQENYHDWSRFNKSAFGEHLRPSSRTFDDASSAHSESPRTPSFTTSCHMRPAAGWVPTRPGSIASSAPPTCDRSSPRFSMARSMHSADSSSIDMSHSSLFEEMKYGASSRSLRSQGGDSCIAPDCVGPDEDSCGDSVFISPATPVNGEADLSPRNRTGFEAASIYDSDTESFREKRRLLRPDGEAQLKAKGFVPHGPQGKSGSEIFDEADADSRSLSTSRWAEMLVTPTDASDLGDDEGSVMDGVSCGQRKNSVRPFTQRERMLALGYDYDSDSDVEASVDSDEIPEERALQLLTSLIEAGGSTSGRQGEHKINMNTIAKLRKEIRKRRRTCAAGRRVNMTLINNQLDDESNEH